MGDDKNEVKDIEHVDPLRTIRVEISSLLVAEPNPISTQQIEQRYEEELGIPLKPARYGFETTEKLLGALQDKIIAVTIQGRKLYRAKCTRELRSLQNLVQCQTTKEERLINAHRRGRQQQRPSQFGSKFKQNAPMQRSFETANFNQNELYNNRKDDFPRPPPVNMISAIYSAVKEFGIANSDGFLLIDVKTLKDVLDKSVTKESSDFGEFCEILRSPVFVPHWKLEVKSLNGGLKHVLTMNARMKHNQNEVQQTKQLNNSSDRSEFLGGRQISKDGKFVGINSLKNALLFHKHQSDVPQPIEHQPIRKPITARITKKSSSETEPDFTNEFEKLEVAEKSTHELVKYSRDDILSLQQNGRDEKVTRTLSDYPTIFIGDDTKTNPMSSRFNFLSTKCESSGFSQNVIHPISKEESEVYKQIERVEDRATSRFVGPSSSRSSFNGGRASPSFGSTFFPDNVKRSGHFHAGSSKASTTASGQIAGDRLFEDLTQSSAMRALERMNAIDSEFNQSVNVQQTRRNDENVSKQFHYTGVTEHHLASLTQAKFVEDPSIDDIKMCAPMYFVPPSSVLICFESGNEDSCARFCEIQRRLQVFFSKQDFEPLRTVKLGSICIARSSDSNEYARVVIVDIEDRTVTGACLDYHGFVTAEIETLAILPEIFLPQYLPCNTFLARINGILSIPSSQFKAIADSIAERSSESNEFILFTTAIFGIDPVENKIVVDWITSDGCWKSTELTQKYNATHRGSDPQHPTSDEVDKATEELEDAVPKPVEVKWYFNESETMLRRQVEILKTMCTNFDRPSSSSSDNRKEKQIESEKRSRDTSVERLVTKRNVLREQPSQPAPIQNESNVNSPASNDVFQDEQIRQLGTLMNSLSKQLYPEVRPTFKYLVSAIAELAKNASKVKLDDKLWDSLHDSTK